MFPALGQLLLVTGWKTKYSWVDGQRGVPALVPDQGPVQGHYHWDLCQALDNRLSIHSSSSINFMEEIGAPLKVLPILELGYKLPLPLHPPPY